MDDVIVFFIGGSNIRTGKIYAYSKNGEKILEVQSLDKKYISMVLESLISVEKNVIKIEGTRLTHGPCLILDNPEENIDFCDGTYGITICESNNYEKYKNEVVKGTYEIEYLGNNQFSEIKNTGYSTYQEVYGLCSN